MNMLSGKEEEKREKGKGKRETKEGRRKNQGAIKSTVTLGDVMKGSAEFVS